MKPEKTEVDALDNLYKNAHIALQSITNVMDVCPDGEFKNELKEEYEGYDKRINEIAEYMRERSVEPKDINPFKKAMMWTSINLNALTDKSESHLADMMLKGTVMGISELMQLIGRDKGEISEESKREIRKLIDLEEDYEKRIKSFL